MDLHPSMPELERNLGFFSEAEAKIFNDSTVAIAGAGGDGGALALQLARLGFGEIRLADPDPFEAQNINRQAVCTSETIGVNKAVAVGNYISKINQGIDVKVFTDGVTPDNIDEFTEGADLVIDETEFTIPDIGVMIARAARRQRVANMMVMNIGFGATATTFHPNGRTFERMLGVSEDDSLADIAKKDIPLSRWVSYLPSYGDLRVLKKTASGEKSAPSVAPGVAMAASIGAVQAGLNLIKGQNNRPLPVYYPKVLMMDAMSAQAKIIRYPILSHYVSLAKGIGVNLAGRNPKADY